MMNYEWWIINANLRYSWICAWHQCSSSVGLKTSTNEKLEKTEQSSPKRFVKPLRRAWATLYSTRYLRRKNDSNKLVGSVERKRTAFIIHNSHLIIIFWVCQCAQKKPSWKARLFLCFCRAMHDQVLRTAAAKPCITTIPHTGLAAKQN